MFSGQPQQHEMVLQMTHESGAEEWYCPTCGRRILMFWPPEYKKIILEVGDEYAIHSGGKGLEADPLQLDPYSTAAAAAAPDVPEAGSAAPADDPYLNLWSDWMEKVNFAQFWEK